MFAIALVVSLLVNAVFTQGFGPGAGIPSALMPPPAAGVSSDQLLAQIDHSKTLHCGYKLETGLFDHNAVTGTYSGVFYDVTEHIAALAGWSVTWTEATPVMMAASRGAGHPDIICSGQRFSVLAAKDSLASQPVLFLTEDKTKKTALGYYVPAAEPRLQAVLNTALQTMQLDGTLDAILAKHKAVLRFYEAAAKPFRTP